MKKRHALAALVLAASMPLTACGDDESASSEPTEVAFELKGSGKKATMEGPVSVKGGTARIVFKNSSKEDAGAQLVRIEGDHTAEEAIAAGGAWADQGKPLPGWVRLVGGAGNTKPGAAVTITQPLPAGKYLAVDVESDAFAEFEVTGGARGEFQAPTARIDAAEYSFSATGLKAGKAQVLIDNKGKEPHFVVGGRIKDGKTIEDVKTFAETEKGDDPLDESAGTFDTAIVGGGVKQVLQLELKKGKYALLCFIPDRKGGSPHHLKGMVSEAVVE